MSTNAIVYILEKPDSSDYKHVKQMCKKMLTQAGITKYNIYDYNSKPELNDISKPHCDAVIVIDSTFYIFVEITSKAKSPQKIRQFEPTIEFIFKRCNNSNTKIAKVLHYTSIDASTARLLKSRKTYREKVVPMSCHESLINKLRSYNYSI